MESITAATPPAVSAGTPRGAGHRQCSAWKLHTLVPGGSCPGTQVSSCIWGLEGCLRWGISLTTHPKWYWACSPTSRGRTSLTLWPPVPCLSSSDFKVLPYMELKLPPSAPQSILLGPGQRQRFQRSVQFPSSPLCCKLPVPLASRGLGTRYPLSVGPFLEPVIPVSSFPIQEIKLPPEPAQGQGGHPMDKTSRGQDGPNPSQGLQSSSPLFCPLGF